MKADAGLSRRAALTFMTGGLSLAPHVVLAALLTGVVTDESHRPVSGAMVTVQDAQRGVAESVFTDEKGRFLLDTELVGQLQLRVRTPYMQDLRTDVLLQQNVARDVKLALRSMKSDQEVSDSLPAAYHFGHISFEPGTPFDRREFQRDCLTCHQLGNDFTRHVMSAEGWEVIVKQMHAWLGNFDEELRQKRARILARGFDGRPLTVRPTFPHDASLKSAKVTEYRLDEAVVPHDADVNPRDGLVYSVDEGADQMVITDRASGSSRYVKALAAGSPVGGKFGTPLLFNLAVSRGPHSLAQASDGKYYVTDAFAGGIGVFNPMTGAWEAPREIPGSALYPHTIRIGRDQVAWFTIAYSDKVGRLDIKSGEIEVLDLPKLKPKGTAAVTVPYGIDISPIDGTVWYARLFGDKIGRIDPQSRVIKEFDSPVSGPRRLRFDKEGILWIAGFSDGELARFDPSTGSSKVYKLPQFAPGYAPAPYAVGIDPRTQDVWITEVMTDYVYRFVRKTERFVAYPMPLRGSYTRDVSFAADGSVCMSNNPIPKVALEGGVLELICISPEGSKR